MLSWAKRAWEGWRAIAAGVLVTVVFALLALNALHVRQRDGARAALAAEQQAHRLTVANYQAAATIAAKRDAETLARVTLEQAAITERITGEYQDRLDDSVAAYERLRASAEAYSRGTGDADLSATREAACRAYAGTSCEALPALLKAAQDNADQLLALIAWAQAQGEVSVAELP